MKSKSKFLEAVLCVLFALLIGVCGGVIGWYSHNRFESGGQNATFEQSGMTVGEYAGVGISMTSKKILPAEYEECGVSPLSEGAYTLIATVTPSNAYNKALEWSVSFVDPSSSWANGKKVTDYVTVTPYPGTVPRATVECLQAFGSQIKVTVASTDGSNVKAECMIDYTKQFLGVTPTIGGGNTITCSTAGETYTAGVNVNYTAGTIESDTTIECYNAWIELKQEFVDAIESYSSTMLENLSVQSVYLQEEDEWKQFITNSTFIGNFFLSSSYSIPMKAKSFFINGFKDRAGSVPGPHATLTVQYRIRKGGEIISSNQSASIDITFAITQ